MTSNMMLVGIILKMLGLEVYTLLKNHNVFSNSGLLHELTASVTRTAVTAAAAAAAAVRIH